MKRFRMLALLAVLVMGSAVAARAATEVKMAGDARIYGVFFANKNFTGWNAANTATEDRFQIWERFRLRTDFVANEAVKFRLGLKVEDTWGHGTFTAANPSTTSISVYQAYLQFKLPNCDTEVTAGLQDLSLPTSSFFYDSVVFGGDRAAALVINAPLIDKTLSVVAGFARMIDTNQSYDTSTTQVSDEFDMYFLTMPVTLEGFKVTPWGAIAVAGKNAGYSGAGFAKNLLSAASYTNGLTSTRLGHWGNNQNTFWWAGGSFEVTALDPVKFYADVIYGAGTQNDHKAAQRSGWFIDLGVEYTGLDFMTPQLFGWWSTGEDKSTNNGSERMPTIKSNWGPGNSFLFDDSQALGKESNMGMTQIGSWGLGASLKNISFMDKLSHILTFTYAHGTNTARALRWARIYGATNIYYTQGYSYVSMGKDLTENEYVMGLNFDTKYMIYENLAAVMETGWAHGSFEKSVWGRTAVRQSEANGNNAYKVAFGLTYKF